MNKKTPIVETHIQRNKPEFNYDGNFEVYPLGTYVKQWETNWVGVIVGYVWIENPDFPECQLQYKLLMKGGKYPVFDEVGNLRSVTECDDNERCRFPCSLVGFDNRVWTPFFDER